jgi:hypothetical protein
LFSIIRKYGKIYEYGSFIRLWERKASNQVGCFYKRVGGDRRGIVVCILFRREALEALRQILNHRGSRIKFCLLRPLPAAVRVA